MSSDFGPIVNTRNLSEGQSVEIASDSKRFRLYKTRVNGVMQLIKEPREEFRHDLITIESLKKEFLIGYSLNHEGLPRYYALEGDRLFLEFIQGETLREFIQRHKEKRADVEFIITLLIQLLEVVGYLHRHGVIHLDIKPDNVMLSAIGNTRVKLLDLGASMSSSHSDTPGFTARYMAPEQKDGNVNFYTDIYQVGLIAEELAAIARGGKSLKGFIRKATSKAPDNRFGSSSEAVEYLTKLRSAGKRRQNAIIGSICSAALAIACIGYFFRTQETTLNPAPTVSEAQEAPILPSDTSPRLPTDNPAPAPPTASKVLTEQLSGQPKVPVSLQTLLPEEELWIETANEEKPTNAEIDAFVGAVLEKHLSPFSTMELYDQEGNMDVEALEAFGEAIESSRRECLAHCRELSETYNRDYDELEEIFIESMGKTVAPYKQHFLDSWE